MATIRTITIKAKYSISNTPLSLQIKRALNPLKKEGLTAYRKWTTPCELVVTAILPDIVVGLITAKVEREPDGISDTVSSPIDRTIKSSFPLKALFSASSNSLYLSISASFSNLMPSYINNSSSEMAKTDVENKRVKHIIIA